MAIDRDFDATVTAAGDMLAAGDDGLEASIGFMRHSGFSQIDCIRAVMTLCNVPLSEAKQIVHFSETWSDVRTAQERFQRDLAKEVERKP